MFPPIVVATLHCVCVTCEHDQREPEPRKMGLLLERYLQLHLSKNLPSFRVGRKYFHLHICGVICQAFHSYSCLYLHRT